VADKDGFSYKNYNTNDSISGDTPRRISFVDNDQMVQTGFNQY